MKEDSKQFFYGRPLPTGLPEITTELIVESSQFLDSLIDAKESKIQIVGKINSLENYLDRLAIFANKSQNLTERSVLANALETWRYFLASQGISIRNHIIHSRDDIVDRRLNEVNTAKWAKINRKSGNSNLGVVYGRAARDSLDKTVPIVVIINAQHSKTKKHIKRSKKYLVHDEFNSAVAGDMIVATETRPLSKRKRFELFAILKKVY